MIPNHAQFLAALQEHKKVRLQFYSTADSGVLDRVCAPVDYGLGPGPQDGLHRYWFWDDASDTDSHALGLLPQQIVELRVTGEVFDPAQCVLVPPQVPSAPPAAQGLPQAAKP
jgi:hypothetical protein